MKRLGTRSVPKVKLPCVQTNDSVSLWVWLIAPRNEYANNRENQIRANDKRRIPLRHQNTTCGSHTCVETHWDISKSWYVILSECGFWGLTGSNSHIPIIPFLRT